MSVLFLATKWSWVLLVLAYGFVARVLTGPKLSPLGQFVTRVVTPRLPLEPKMVPGPPKRFAQCIGATFTVSAVVAQFAFGQTGLAFLLVGMIVIAASLEAFIGFCLGCKVFAILMHFGIIPSDVCEACDDLSLRFRRAA